MTIAGHTFNDPVTGRCSCGYSFADVSSARKENVGEPHWAHQGQLTTLEWEQIVTERERRWTLLVGIASGQGIGGMLPGDEGGEEL